MIRATLNPLLIQAAALIEARTGLACLSASRLNLAGVLHDVANGDLPGLVRALQTSPDSAPVWQKVLRALVIGETYFFRNRPHFDLLTAHILPDILARKRGLADDSLNIWSVGCATGEETYSLAVTLYQNLADLPRWTLRLIGTDINDSALSVARAGVYRPWSFRQTTPDFQTAYFDVTDGGLRLKPFIHALPTFRRANLFDGPPLPGLDLIFCCNVLLYFEESRVEQAENLLYDALAPGGWLVLGQAEALRFQRARWTMRLFPRAVLYQKPPALIRARPPDKTGEAPFAPDEAAPVTVRGFQPSAENYPAALRHFHHKRYDEALEALSPLLNAAPVHVPARVLAACIHANRGSLPEAHRHLEAALQSNPLAAEAYYLKGLLFLEIGAEAAAADALRAALYCRRGHPLATMILSSIYQRRGELERARRLLSEAVDVLAGLPPDAPVSDLSDMTAESILSYLKTQLAG